ncbi:3-deoxy-7-phosphoheptulonate synthase [Bathymodiolus platifrons methanotrophic gill symbiont]|uniref:3-deoxy-7-phosphoheptulonate synthase AroG n=1 Tax=Bathymodiolus platifrons methanotrophic gill symbiont TaxID=113268 RepID=UPI000B422A55|nr:3-deoxy-7-phosphoheptulonate synthase AroG [Bathymodiolus platifrons methanotrophic gill symbiont]TXL14761.1 3-deoxy-7-phosphoheptulonate synthase [Methylococcaceae bacterium HT4]TXL18846.1 3-deoxy-7-phosphoheptulonate synthase [Methylococcaceae bacterium HT5]TXL22954.1 3-deoxy-7-phosphoheptulonate synthase [Methylococcaceae bacterium HT2]GAW84929.1 3-deoxy-7-phosphoheptulonate synthase [Bathymodiolus platifrons methanotrophic gill symbiont]GFO76108.1 3-deoxy-7-phosphoheptulonate synthase [
MQSQFNTDNLRIRETKEVMAPVQVHEELVITEVAAKTTTDARRAVHDILMGQDDRLVVVVGPCSIHDTKAALEYAQQLNSLKDELKQDLHIIMRVYFEKPRTTVGWKGLINDPDLDDSFNINKGLRVARKLLLELNTLGVPAATEYLDLITPQYISDLIAWGAIGARTTESQCHRELASGLSCPVGFKNATDGTIAIANDAINAAMRPHHFLSVTSAGHSAIFSTTGNEDAHIILRGGTDGPNYDAVSVDKVALSMEKAGLKANIMIDLSHANSLKQCQRQLLVADDVAEQIAGGDQRIMGVMIESHLKSGRQDIVAGQPLVYGQSVTDACIDWADTKIALKNLALAVQNRRTVKN